ncbi:phosphoglycerate mutase-like protein, partial [Conidiobolus coronatus NRRL 28638]
MNLLSALALQLIGFTSVTLAQYPIKDEPAKGSTYDYCQANVINPEKYTPLFPEGELLSVQLFHRHGDRTPTVFIPPKFQVKDTWNCAAEVRAPTFKPLGENRTLHNLYINQCEEGAIHCSYNPVAKRSLWKGNCYDGQLTPKGIDQLTETGKKFREIYVNKLKFLPENWSDANKQLYVRSTNVQRTEQSVASILNGWFPLKDGERNARPIHYEVIPTQFDMLSPNSQCTKLKNLNAEFKKS